MHRFTALDGLRGWCALLVAIFHFNYLWHGFGQEFVRHSFLFVDFFFVLSGFVLAAAYGERLGKTISLPAFVLRRVGRLWPLHVSLLALFVLNELAKLLFRQWMATEHPPFSDSTSPAAIITNLLMIHALGMHDTLTWNFPSWSISVEFYSYLVFAMVLLLLPGKRVLLFMALSICSLFGLWHFAPHYLHTTYDYGLLRCMYGFFMGSALYHIYQYTYAKASKARMQFAAAEWVVLAAVAAFVVTAGDTPLLFAAPPLFAVVVYVFAFEAGTLSRWLNMAAIQKLGEWSYSIYMVHKFLLVMMQQGFKLMAKLLGFDLMVGEYTDIFGESMKTYMIANSWVMDALLVGYIVAICAAATVTYRFIETPGRQYFNRLAAMRDSKLYRPASA